MTKLRVTYRNVLDGTKRVLIGGLDQATADLAMRSWGDPGRPKFYMPEAAIEPCDGARDGDIIPEEKPHAV